jgi:hypothetical protein
MPRIVGFTGSSEIITPAQLDALPALLDGLTEFHHGSCWEADVKAARLVRSLFSFGVTIVSHPGPIGDESGVDDIILPSLPYLDRNRVIVDSSGELIACPRGTVEVLRSGTWATIRYARQLKRKITIIFRDGIVRVFE